MDSIRRLPFILLALGLALPRALAARPCTLDELRTIMSRLEQGIFSPEDEARVVALESHAHLSAEDKARELYDIYLEARLRLIPEPDRSRLASQIPKLVPREGYLVVGEFMKGLLGSYVDVAVPKGFRSSALEFMIQVHEIEHLIQSQTYGKGYFRPSISMFLGSRRIPEFFLIEEGPMRMEWEYLSRVPKAERERLAQMLQQDRHITEGSREFLVRALLNPGSSQADHLVIERAHGRYSLEQIQKIYKKERELAVFGIGSSAGGATFVGGLIYLGWATEYCLDNYYNQAGELIRHDAYGRLVCERLLTVQFRVDLRRSGAPDPEPTSDPDLEKKYPKTFKKPPSGTHFDY